ncbi:HpsJ family protein [Anabaena sp. UHCC 0399]|uniref:HpsJ family protein n=1 Tax=Anabaena sp. UHCC 0399 TaxID=3110238 RepID=UPI002B200C10|nr:HpsJ family protein [Anabaena sp. UHCC 0399]MEA5564687.1 HpsJ family protein [Anabaena sp. UHCC 0399]
MTCCLNPACDNPPHTDGVKFCSSCGVPLIVLRNRYRPIKTLGGGGFGKTYLAEDVDKLNEHCVIKQFAPQVQGTGALNKATELFEQEAKRLQQLGKHPQIPTLLAYFNEDNRLYLVQEFIDGQNLLKELQNQGSFTEQKVRELLLDLLDILKTVHQQKVIHRDIKPENIIRHSDGKLVLIDFGASKQLTATVMTQVGTTIGSFGYAPLEQMQGGEAYPASDLYSVGATCFHLLTGIHPWELWKRQGYGWVGSWREHLQQPVSQELGQMLDKFLQEEYQQRYQSAEAVLHDLNSSPPLPATNPNPSQHNVSSSPKKSIYKYFIVLPLMVLVGFGIVYLQGLMQNAGIDKFVSSEPKKSATNNPIDATPKDAAAYKLEGLKKYNQKDFRGAIEAYTQVIKIDPNDVEAYRRRGFARRDSGDEQGAIADFNQAIQPALKQIDEQAQKAEAQLEQQLLQLQSQLNSEQGKAQLEQLRNQAKAQFTELLKDEQKYKQALENPQITPAQKELLKKFKANPQELDKFITQQTDTQGLANQRLTQIRQRKEEAEKKLRDKVLRWQLGENGD